jgi:heat shock protein HtpX
MASFFDEIARNRLRSILLMLVFGLLFAVIVFVFVLFLGGGLFAFAAGMLLILAYACFAYFMGSRVVLAVSGAKEADRKQYSNLYEIVESLALATQVPMPKVYIINDPNPNAFATGKNKKAASVAVTTGLLAMMNKEELTGVLSHEMSHVADNDIQFMMLAVIFAGVIGLVAAVIRNALFFGFGLGNNRNGGIILLIAIVIGILAPIMALLVRLAISRRREYMADANGARLIRDPQALASALTKIKGYAASPMAQPVKKANEITASLYFSSPFKASNVMNLFSTHPPIDERIKRLQQMY